MLNNLLQFLILKKHTSPGKHWWGFMDIHPKNNLFLFDSLGLEGFKLL